MKAIAVKIYIKFTQKLKTVLFGGESDDAKELTGGARIMEIFARDFASALQSVDASGCVSVREIRTAIVNNRGVHGGLFVSEEALEKLILHCLDAFAQPCLLCVEQVKNEFQAVISNLAMPEFQYFPLLRDAVIRETLQLLDGKTSLTKDMVGILLGMEKAFVNTAHPALDPERIKAMQGTAIASARAVAFPPFSHS